jgi:hypothetical protein
MFMLECIVNYLINKFDVKRDVAFIFYMEVLNRHKLEHLISHIGQFKNFDELKKFYLGGN